MANDEEFGSRLAAVEAGVAAARAEAAAARADAAAARELAVGADADVADVRTALAAHFRVLNALRETQREGFARMDQRFATVDQNFATVHQRFATVEQNFATVEQQFAVVKAGIAQIISLLTTPTDPGSQAGQN